MAQTQIGSTILGTEKYDGTGDAVAISGDGNRIIFGANRVSNGNLENVGQAKIYENQNGNWVQIGTTIMGSQEDERLGTSVDISDEGNRIAIAGRFGARVYDYENGSWQLNYNYSSFPDFDETSGGARRIRFANNGKILVISDSHFDFGDVVVYEENNSVWSKKGNKILAYAESSNFAVSKSGDRLAIADGFEVTVQNITGFFSNIKIYDFVNGNWVSNHSIELVDSSEIVSNGARGLVLSDGFDLSANGNRLVVMLANDDQVEDQGFLMTFDFEDNEWKEKGNQEILMDNPYGASLRLSDGGDIAVVGITDDVWFENPNYVTVFKFNNSNWQEIGSRFQGSQSDEAANCFVDITNNGKQIVWGGKVNNQTDSLGTIQVFDYGTIVSVSEEVLNQKIAVFPNPTKSNVRITIDDNSNYLLKLYNVAGKQIATYNYKNEGIELLLEGLESGLYILNIYADNGERLISKKIVKQ